MICWKGSGAFMNTDSHSINAITVTDDMDTGGLGDVYI
jgi:hypothetical protein